MTKIKPTILVTLCIFLTAALAVTVRSLVQAGTQDVVSFARHDVYVGESWFDACFADLDGDGIQDIVAVKGASTYYYPDSLYWWQNDGTPINGGWTMRVIDEYFPYAKAIYVTDLDKDSDLDVLAVSSGTFPETAWWENDGTPKDGGWIRHTIDDELDTMDAFAADLDGDDDLDIIVASYQAGVFAWFESDGIPTDGGWTEHIIADSLFGASAVVAFDLNDDKYLDIVGAVAGDYFEGDGQIAWWQSDGTPADGGWTKHVLATNFALASDVHVVDLDDDHDPDILAVGAHMYEFTWWENFGDEPFVKHTLLGNYEYANSISTGDLDSDGDTDVFAASSTKGIAWWENDGQEAFTRYPISDSTNLWVSVDAADIDEDADLDLLTAAMLSGFITWWEQGGYAPQPLGSVYLPMVRNSLSLTPTPTEPPACPMFSAGQWDGDASFVVPSDRTRILDFAAEIETSVCGNYTLTVPEITIIDCGIEFEATTGNVEITVTGNFTSETKMEGRFYVLVGGISLCFEPWDSSWISNQTGE